MPLLDLFIDCSEAADPGVVVQRGRNLHVCRYVRQASSPTWKERQEWQDEERFLYP